MDDRGVGIEDLAAAFDFVSVPGFCAGLLDFATEVDVCEKVRGFKAM